MTDIAAITTSDGLERILTLELARVTEAAAIASYEQVGRGNEHNADQAAVDAMRRALNQCNFDGTVVIGEGERDEAPMLFIGEKVGTGKGPIICKSDKYPPASSPIAGITSVSTLKPNDFSSCSTIAVFVAPPSPCGCAIFDFTCSQ